VPHCEKLTSEALSMDHTVVTLQTRHTCLYLSVHQMAPPLYSDGSHLIAAYYSFIDPRKVKG